jgi:hypothetical protein
MGMLAKMMWYTMIDYKGDGLGIHVFFNNGQILFYFVITYYIIM